MALFKRITVVFVLICPFFLLMPFSYRAYAGGPVHGAKAAGMGTAFVGVADDPSAVLFNPAGLTQMEAARIYGGLTALTLSTRYESPSGESEETLDNIFYVPHLYASSPFKSVYMGLGLYAPFGIGGREWDEGGPTRYHSTSNFISTFSVNPVVAWRASEALSLAFGVDHMISRMESARMLDQSAMSTPDASNNLDAEGDGWGYNIGALYWPTDSLRVGLAYRSPIEVDYEGKISISGIAPLLQPLLGSSYSTRISSSCTFPEIYSFGLGYSANEALTLAFDVELVRWSSFGSMTIDIKDEVPAAGIMDSRIELGWRDSWQYKAGVDYKLKGAYSLRAGYAYIKGFIPQSSLDPGSPESDQHNLTIGLGRSSGRLTVDLFYDYAKYTRAEAEGGSLDGSYKSKAHYLGAGAGYAF